MFDKICKKLKSDDVVKLKDEKKYLIWNSLENLIVHNKKYSNQKWSLPDEAIKKLEDVSRKISPTDIRICYRRLFDNESYRLIYEKDDYEESERLLYKKRKEIVQKIVSEDGIEGIIKFSKKIKYKYQLGVILADCNLKKEQEDVIIKLIDDNISYEVSEGYISKKYSVNGKDWLDHIDFQNLDTKGKVRIFIQLPGNKYTWGKVKEKLGKYEYCYWKKMNIYKIDIEENDYPIEKLIRYERFADAIELINRATINGKNFDSKNAIKVLDEMVKKSSNSNFNNMDFYNIRNIIKYLQKIKYNEKDLARIEWEYLAILDSEDEIRPITLERELSENPELYIEMISFIYKPKNQKKKIKISNDAEKIVTNAYRLINMWKIVPGTNAKGHIDEVKLKK